MATRQQRLEARLQRLQRLQEEKAEIDNQIEDTQQVLRTSERKRRTRQAIIGWETLIAVVGKLGEPVTFRHLGDIEAFLDRYVQGRNNRQTWGLQPPADGGAEAGRGQQPQKAVPSASKAQVEPAPASRPAPPKPLHEPVSQDDLAKEFM